MTMTGVPAGEGSELGERGFQPCCVAAAGTLLPAPRRPGAGAAHRRPAGLRSPGVAGPAAADGPVRRSAVPGHRPAAVRPGDLRQAGLSWRKIGTLRDLAGRLSDGRLDPDVLSRLPDDELMAELTAIPGIGPWTVQGALIIALGREDVVLPGDLGLRKAVQAAYQLEHLPTQEEVLAIAEKWRPYRSLATSYLFSAAFESAEAPPVARLGSA